MLDLSKGSAPIKSSNPGTWTSVWYTSQPTPATPDELLVYVGQAATLQLEHTEALKLELGGYWATYKNTHHLKDRNTFYVAKALFGPAIEGSKEQALALYDFYNRCVGLGEGARAASCSSALLAE